MGALILLLALSGAAAPAVYQCTVDGTTVYADHPCGTDARRVIVSPNTAHFVQEVAPAPLPVEPVKQSQSVAQPKTPARNSQLNCPSQTQTRHAIFWHKVMLCMTPKQVIDAQGKYGYHSMKTAVYSGVRYTRWYYPVHEEGWPTIVRFQNGVVTGWE